MPGYIAPTAEEEEQEMAELSCRRRVCRGTIGALITRNDRAIRRLSGMHRGFRYDLYPLLKVFPQ
jgi:hypothetical protein